jgi:hypothetical protein
MLGFGKCTYLKYGMLLKILPFALYTYTYSVSSGFAKQIMSVLPKLKRQLNHFNDCKLDRRQYQLTASQSQKSKLRYDLR